MEILILMYTYISQRNSKLKDKSEKFANLIRPYMALNKHCEFNIKRSLTF